MTDQSIVWLLSIAVLGTLLLSFLAYRTAAYDVQLNVNNLFDREYIVSGHGSSKLLNMPGAPRNVRVTARYRF